MFSKASSVAGAARNESDIESIPKWIVVLFFTLAAAPSAIQLVVILEVVVWNRIATCHKDWHNNSSLDG
jgi:hypothetical protein